MTSDYPINSRIAVRITRVLPSGLLGWVEGGQRAIVRNREIAWGRTRPRSDYVGETHWGVVIGFNPAYQELEVSLRFAERDPWQEVAEKYAPKTVVQGRVVGLIEKAAFVELEPGVEGFLPVTELPSVAAEDLAEWFWVGDYVRALVTEVDVSRRRMRLSLNALLERRDAQFQRRLWAAECDETSDITLAEILPRDVRLRLLRIAQGTARPSPHVETLRVLVVEDDETFAAGMETWLARNGCQVSIVADGESALDRLGKQPDVFHLVLIDWNLPGLKGHEVVRRLQEAGCPARLVIILETAPLMGRLDVMEALCETGVDVFSKADGESTQAGLIAILDELRQRRTLQREPGGRWLEVPWMLGDRTPAAAHAEPVPHEIAPGDIQAILERLAVETRATTVALVSLAPGSQRFQVECGVGETLALDKAPPDVIYSPLGTVICEGRKVSAAVRPDSARFKRLLALLPFEGFLGVPVPEPGAPSRGLILLKRRGHFGGADRVQARLCATLVATMLQQGRLLRSLQPWQAQNVAGQLVASAIHEINNKLGGIERQIEALREDVRLLAARPDEADDAAFVRKMERAVEAIWRAQREAAALRDQYLRLTASDNVDQADLASVVQDAVLLMRPQAQCSDIIIETRLAPDLPQIRMKAGSLAQVMLNLLLNAVQQMASLGRRGCITLDVSYIADSPLPIQVRVRDEGPGIHFQNWERIFDFGFTTKKTGGAGLGLSISHQIVRNLGGDLRVEESCILWGTTFLLELPKGAGVHG